MICEDYNVIDLDDYINDFITKNVSKVIDLHINNYHDGSREVFYAYLRYIPQ